MNEIDWAKMGALGSPNGGMGLAWSNPAEIPSPMMGNSAGPMMPIDGTTYNNSGERSELRPYNSELSHYTSASA